MGLSKGHKEKIRAGNKAHRARQKAVKDATAEAKIKTLTHQNQRGPAGHKAIVRKAQLLDRKARAWRMVVAGEGLGLTSMADIGRELGVSAGTARQYILDVANELQRHMFNDASTLRAVQAAQLNALKKAHWANRHKRENADVLLKTFDREARLLGLDVEPAEGTFTATQVRNMLRSLAELFMDLVPDVDKRKQFALGLRRQLPSAARTHVEAETPTEAIVDGTLAEPAEELSL